MPEPQYITGEKPQIGDIIYPPFKSGVWKVRELLLDQDPPAVLAQASLSIKKMRFGVKRCSLHYRDAAPANG